MTLVQSLLSGDRLTLARLLTQIENDTSQGRAALMELFAHTGDAHLIGVTGAPGTGKSSLVNRIAYQYRHPTDEIEPKKVAIVAVDPTSPFSGGAVMGDRIRMRDLTGDPGVFIRSMASRGSLGGLAVATAGVVQAFDATGYEIILIETVGAGQAEVDIARLAHTTLVVEAPGLGDDIQAIKAGILEIADVLVINKCDRPGADQTERALRNMLQLAHPGPRVFQHHGAALEVDGAQPQNQETQIWLPTIQRTIATEGEGIPELVETIAAHRAHLKASGDLQRRERARLAVELESLLQTNMMARWRDSLANGFYDTVLAQLVAREISPHAAVEILLQGEKSK
ncbi:MAG: methylmalonyl Co-A mutase-associated GTPase MeaB [Anaerolineales bacterium]|nr:methylmalonyl Co-A mutase-associated GTPase MeaB [Anaerolineales bacterium]